MIRASVMQDQKSTQTKSITPPLVIKLPSQAGEKAREKSSSPSPLSEEEEEEEEDDWDTFQSFPASTHEVAPSVMVEMGKNLSSSDVKELDDSEDNDFMQVENKAIPINTNNAFLDHPSIKIAEEYRDPLNDQHEEIGAHTQNLGIAEELDNSEDHDGHDTKEYDGFRHEGDELMPNDRDDTFLDQPSVEIAEGHSYPSDDDPHEDITGKLPGDEIMQDYNCPSNDNDVPTDGQMVINGDDNNKSDLQSGEDAEGSIQVDLLAKNEQSPVRNSNDDVEKKIMMGSGSSSSEESGIGTGRSESQDDRPKIEMPSHIDNV